MIHEKEAAQRDAAYRYAEAILDERAAAEALIRAQDFHKKCAAALQVAETNFVTAGKIGDKHTIANKYVVGDLLVSNYAGHARAEDLIRLG